MRQELLADVDSKKASGNKTSSWTWIDFVEEELYDG
jgi:hypothetical protein